MNSRNFQQFLSFREQKYLVVDGELLFSCRKNDKTKLLIWLND